MALVLKLARQVVLPTIWLAKDEWMLRYRRNLPLLTELLDGSPATVLEDVGGFEHLVVAALWTDRMEKKCIGCKRIKSVEDFGIQKQNHDRGLRVLRPRCRGCEGAMVLQGRHALETVGTG